MLKEFGLKVSNLYISQIKRKCGIEAGENYNLPKTENPKVPQCPKEHRPAKYSLYMLEDRLTSHLNMVDDEAQDRMETLISQMMDKQGITAELKARDQMAWVGAVNNIRNAAEEIVLKELVYI